MAIVETLIVPSAGADAECRAVGLSALVGMENAAAAWAHSLAFFYIHLTYSDHSSGYHRKMKTYVYTKICVLLFLAALFVINKNWN